VIITVLVGCILLEDTLVILVLPIPSQSTEWLMLFLSSRNFSENAMMLYVSYLCIKKAVRQLRLRSSQVPTATATTSEGQKLDLISHTRGPAARLC